MSTPEQITRNYGNMSDVDMLEFAQTILGQFINDKADFVAYDPDFDDPFEPDWQAAIVAAEQIPTDEALVDQLQGLTQTVEEKMDDCRHKFQSAKRFIEKAFPNNEPVHNEFGYDNYDSARKSQTSMIQFMENFHRVAENYKTQLIAQNYTQMHIDEIETLRDELHSANEQQEAFKGGRPVLTQDRIITLNTSWNITVDVCRAGKDIFHDNPAKYESYLLPGTQSGAPQTLPITLITDQTVPGPVTIGITGNTFATGNQQILIEYGNGSTDMLTILDGMPTSATRSYAMSGIYNITLTPVQAGAFDALDTILIANIKATEGTIPTEISNITHFDGRGNNFPVDTINQFLITINDFGTDNGIIKLEDGTNAAPTGQGIAAMNKLISRGWTVTTN